MGFEELPEGGLAEESSELISGVSIPGDIVQVATGDAHACALRSSGQVLCWGATSHPPAGGADAGSSIGPAVVPGVSGAVEIAAGLQLSCARLANGTVSCWGRGKAAQVRAGASNVLQISVNNDSVYALRAGGTVLRSSLDAASWTAVPFLDNATRLSSFGTTACALTQNGGAVCWGRNTSGQVGDGTTSGSRFDPRPVVNLVDAVQLAVGQSHGCALRANGTVACWGLNTAGRLGIGSTTIASSLLPVPTAGLTAVSSISSGFGHTCAVRSTGTLYCWGLGSYGRSFADGGLSTGGGAIGDGTLESRLSPVQVAELGGVVEVDASNGFTCARRVNGAVFCWGRNDQGQVGDGTTLDRARPVRVPLDPCGQLSPGKSLGKEQSVASCNGSYRFKYQTDGNVVLTNSAQRALWSSNTSGLTSTRLAMQEDGNLVLYNGSVAIWSTATAGRTGAALKVRDDGTAQLLHGAQQVWSTRSGPVTLDQAICVGVTQAACSGCHALAPACTTSLDCAAGQECNAGRCQQAACVDDASCGAGQACIGGTCQLRPLCNADPDCGTGACVLGSCQTRGPFYLKPYGAPPPPPGTGNPATTNACFSACPAPFAVCGGSCVDPKRDLNHCGACGTRCTTACTNGVCS